MEIVAAATATVVEKESRESLSEDRETNREEVFRNLKMVVEKLCEQSVEYVRLDEPVK